MSGADRRHEARRAGFITDVGINDDFSVIEAPSGNQHLG
jgi:hypothetical protein